MADYGARIRAVCDYLETLDGSKFDYMYFPVGNRLSFRDSPNKEFGCYIAFALGHAIPESLNYGEALRWLGLYDNFGFLLPTPPMRGQRAFREGIQNLRVYADELYPVTPKHTGMLTNVKAIFERVAA